MKKLLKILIYIFAFLLIYFLEAYLFEYIKIANVKPNMFIIGIITISLYKKPEKSFFIGVGIGLLIDILNSKAIGITAIGLGVLAYGISKVRNIFSIESKLSLIIFIFIATIAYEILNYALQVILIDSTLEVRKMIETISIETLYNVLLTIIFYPICKKILKIGTEQLEGSRCDTYLKKMR